MINDLVLVCTFAPALSFVVLVVALQLAYVGRRWVRGIERNSS